MKLSSLFNTAFFALVLSFSVVACTDGNEPNLDDSGSKVILPIRRAFILNEGNWGSNNAGIAFYAPNGDASFIGDIYYKQNEARLGDLANTMIEHRNYIYVVVGGSKYIARLNAAGVELDRLAFTSNEGEPRCVAAEGDYLYVTHLGGRISKLNIETLDVVDTFQEGDNLEGVVAKDGKLYVANSWRGVYEYNTELLVVNAATMTLEQKIEVVINPNDLYEIDGQIYLVSNGDYDGVPATLQSIDSNGKSTIITPAAKITKGHDGLIYCVNSSFDANWTPINVFFTYDPQTKTVNNTSFLKNAPESFATASIYMLEVDEKDGDIYVATAPYDANGTVYRFDRQGYLKESFDAGGMYPSQMIFVE